MRRTELIALTISLLLFHACRALSQERNILENECESFRNATLLELVRFLNGVVPDEKNGDCITWAIKKLGKEQYEPAIPALIKLIDFRRPPTPREKQGFIMHPPIIWDIYPAAGAIDLIGKKALPEVLRVIKAESSSATARENAVAVWMGMYRYESPQGVALLKQEEMQTKDIAIKQRLKWAISKAVQTWCNPPDEAACKAAAQNGIRSIKR